MRSEVKTLWNSILDPSNDEKILDIMSFFSLVINGQITNEEVNEVLRGQI